MTMTTAEVITLVEQFIEAIANSDGTNENCDDQIDALWPLSRAIEAGEIENADAAALIDLACDEDDDTVATSHLEQALEFLRGTAITK